MSRPPKAEISLAEKLRKLKEAGINESKPPDPEMEELDTIAGRVVSILNIIKAKPLKSTEMTYLIMYDINDNKVRTQISKYLIKKSCVRIQKSVFLARTENKFFQEIYETLKEINEYYENKDSIILVPVNSTDVRSMKLIGQNIDIQMITDKPNTLFF